MVDEFADSDRELCPDGACIGLIGPDGRCKECGTPGIRATQDPRLQGLRAEDEVARELESNIIKGDQPAASDDFDDRELCPDGACIGLLGPDGRCKDCGTPARASGAGREN